MRSFTFVGCILLFTCASVSGNNVEQSDVNPPPHQRGYKYSKTLNAFYKVHQVPKIWSTAKALCEAEGAVLMWFHNEDEFREMLHIFPKSHYSILMGMHSKFSKNHLVTLTGLPVENVYHRWANHQPNNTRDNYDCVSISQEGTMSVLNCDFALPFMCRRDYDGNLHYLNNECRTHDKAYIYNNGKCYKAHTEPKNWTDAYDICFAEGGHLAVINSIEESQALVEVIKNAHVYGNYWVNKCAFLLGFHDMFVEGEYRTIYGKTLKEAGFEKFGPGQPNNYGDQNCGGMRADGNLYDLFCTKPYPFICERELYNVIKK